MLNVIMLSVHIMTSIVIISVVMLSVFMPSLVFYILGMLSVNVLCVVMLSVLIIPSVVEAIYAFASCGILPVEHLPHHLKVVVSSPAPATGISSENIAKKKFNNILVGLWHKINKLLEQWAISRILVSI
jgi:hypothetical protein